MNKQIDEIIKVALEDNARVMDLAHDLYEAGRRSVPEGLPGATSQKIWDKIRKSYWDDHEMLADVLANWFNDPDRDAPVKTVMSEADALQALRDFFVFEPDEYRRAVVADMAKDARKLVQPLRVLANVPQAPGDQKPSNRDVRENVGGRFEPDAPVKQPMHPDLEWLAKLPPEKLEGIPRRRGEERTPYFFRYASHEGRYDDNRVGWGFDPAKAPNGVETFTLAEIEQARRHLAKQKANQMSGPCKQQFDAGKAREESAYNYAQASILNLLVNLPDYETWFELHGSETAYHTAAPFLRHDLATVHELYRMFRARLLDELRQAGVIGEKS